MLVPRLSIQKKSSRPSGCSILYRVHPWKPNLSCGSLISRQLRFFLLQTLDSLLTSLRVRSWSFNLLRLPDLTPGSPAWVSILEVIWLCIRFVLVNNNPCHPLTLLERYSRHKRMLATTLLKCTRMSDVSGLVSKIWSTIYSRIILDRYILYIPIGK